MASDRAARVAARIADRYTDYLPRDERYDLIDHVRRAIRREGEAGMTQFPWRAVAPNVGPPCDACRVYECNFAIVFGERTLYLCKACIGRLRLTTKAVQREIQENTPKKVRPS